jgi:hypothetical protein
VLQASEGGSFSVGNQKFKAKEGMTPTPIPLALREGLPGAMPPNVRTPRTARAPSSRFSTLAAATDKIVVSKNVLIGLCLTTFAFGIVTTLAADRIHARASEAVPLHEPEPVVLQTTPIEPEPKAPAAAAPAVQAAPTPVAQAASAPAAQAASAPAVQAAPAPVAQAAPAPAVEAAPVAAAEAVVVQLPPASETAPRLPTRLSPPRAVRQAAAAPVRVAPTTRKRASAAVESDPTEAAPDDGPLPAPVKKKWIDPFGE